MANNKILSTEDIEEVRWKMDYSNGLLDAAISDIEELVKQFENDAIVQTFFVSGNFGEDKKQKLESIKNIAAKVKESINNNLIPETNKILEAQKALNEGGV